MTVFKTNTTGPFIQESEFDTAVDVVVHQPNLEMEFGGFHPSGYLFEKPVNREETLLHHSQFVSTLRRFNCNVHLVSNVILTAICDKEKRPLVEDLACELLTYELSSGFDQDMLNEDQKYLLTDDYKKTVISGMSSAQLLRLILLRPTVYLKPSPKNTPLIADYTKTDPLANLVFCRDQQMTTAAGLVMSRMGSQQRRDEVRVMKFVLEQLGINIIGAIPEPETGEGGDFIPFSKEISMIGVGLRTTEGAGKYMMDNDLFGTRYVALVHDRFDCNQDRLHLDCVFNTINENLCLLHEDLIPDDSTIRREVDLYEKKDDKYELIEKDIHFARYLESLGLEIIPVPSDWQLNYACNHINLGKERLVTIHEGIAEVIRNHPKFSGIVEYVQFSGITSMYGGAHCATQVIRRKI
eukprot:TRINITY_DN2944_c0_g1_i3.p1 TRINITY_DN2944_c0_g1~~TRINITY_DN2944_c0_g1_i3.p1  ORF type:complete len:420 (+),score=106.81 TRINITY_DN2944_c0_g1_i3:31-1260(+)